MNAQDFLSFGILLCLSALLVLWLSLGLMALAVATVPVSVSPGRLTYPPLEALIFANLANAVVVLGKLTYPLYALPR